MAETAIIPFPISLYVCNDAIGDSATGKVTIVNIWDTVRIPPGAAFPYTLKKLCAFAWLRDGLGEMDSRIDLLYAGNGKIVHRSRNYALSFPDRRKSVFAKYIIEQCVFADPGLYIVELYVAEQFVDDQTISVRNDAKE